MLTNNYDEKELVNKLLLCSLVIDLPKIILYNAEEQYIGNGSVYLKTDGTFCLKFFNDKDFSVSESINILFEDDRTVLLPFRMEAYDHNNKKYVCHHLTNNTTVLKLTEFEIHSNIEADFNVGYYSKVVFYGNYILPGHKIASTNTTVGNSFGYTDMQSIWEVILNKDLTLVFSKFDNYMEMVIMHNKQFDLMYDLVIKMVETFDFLCGKESEPVYINIINKGHRLFSRRNMLLAQSTFAAPIIMGHSHGSDFTENHISLFKSYFSYITTPSGRILTDIHKRIVSASRSYIFASGLVISVQIETLCKEFFRSYYSEDQHYKLQAQQALELLKDTDSKKFDAVIRHIQHSISKTINIKNILRNLAKEGIIQPDLIKSWIKMRNLTTHGDKDTKDDWTDFLNETFHCTNLYYQLIFHLIGYRGMMTYHHAYDSHSLMDVQKSTQVNVT